MVEGVCGGSCDGSFCIGPINGQDGTLLPLGYTFNRISIREGNIKGLVRASIALVWPMKVMCPPGFGLFVKRKLTNPIGFDVHASNLSPIMVMFLDHVQCEGKHWLVPSQCAQKLCLRFCQYMNSNKSTLVSLGASLNDVRLYIHAGLIRIGILDMDAARMLPLGEIGFGPNLSFGWASPLPLVASVWKELTRKKQKMDLSPHPHITPSIPIAPSPPRTGAVSAFNTFSEASKSTGRKGRASGEKWRERSAFGGPWWFPRQVHEDNQCSP